MIRILSYFLIIVVAWSLFSYNVHNNCINHQIVNVTICSSIWTSAKYNTTLCCYYGSNGENCIDGTINQEMIIDKRIMFLDCILSVLTTFFIDYLLFSSLGIKLTPSRDGKLPVGELPIALMVCSSSMFIVTYYYLILNNLCQST